MTITERRDSIADVLGIPPEGMKDVTVGDMKNVKLSRSGIRHSLKEYKSIQKDALMMNPKAFDQALKNAHYEKDEPTKKCYIDRTMRYKSKCLVDNQEYIVGFIIHHNSLDQAYHLYHISIYDSQ